ncbi:MAG: efflux RND transporter periplasmic adaptor subunit [Rhodocyclaceae bacterium]|nr:efflux RND transporter periplasmic adaptor subunit [Rhodocyclaceae bacterium]
MKKPILTRKQAIGGAVLLLVVGIAIMVLRGGGPGAVQVSAAKVVRGDLKPTLFGIGVVEAQRNILVGPTVAGRVAKVYVEQGAQVEAGTLLAEMDPIDLNERLSASRQATLRAKSSIAASQALAQEAESRKATADANAKRYASLRERGFISIEAERNKGHEARAAGAALQASQANIGVSSADAARLSSEAAALEKQLANTQLIAPVAGLVITRDLEPGSTAVAGQAVVRLAEKDSLWLRVRIDQGRSAGLAIGLPASIKLRSRPGESFSGKLARIEQLSDAVTEERLVMVAFDQPPVGLTLNEMAEVTLTLPARSNALTLPPAALVRQNGQTGVFTVEDGRARFVTVNVGIRTENGVEILNGIAEGAQVVTQKAKPLVDGDRLRISSDTGARP